MKKKKNDIEIPEGINRIMLHACCAPCSSAIVEWMMAHDVRPTIFYFNPNIWPHEEYEIRKEESKRHATSLGIEWIDGDYNHETWLAAIKGLEGEPERGGRCLQCFRMRLIATAMEAQRRGFTTIATCKTAIATTSTANSRDRRRVSVTRFFRSDIHILLFICHKIVYIEHTQFQRLSRSMA